MFFHQFRDTTEAYSKLQTTYSDVEVKKVALEERLARIKELYEWGDLAKAEYQGKREAIQRELKGLVMPEDEQHILSKL